MLLQRMLKRQSRYYIKDALGAIFVMQATLIKLAIIVTAMFYSFSPLIAGASWGSQVGGSLKRYFYKVKFTNLLYPTTFVRAEIYRVYKDAGLGIEHEYLGVRTIWQAADTETKEVLFTTGLVAAGDDQFFKQALQAESPTIIKVADFNERKDFESVIKKMNAQMRAHPANWTCRLTFRMVATPIFGQPCTNAVEALLGTI